MKRKGIYTGSVLGRDKGCTVKYSPPSEGVPESKARGNSQKKLSISVCFGIGATIRIGQEIQCLPYAVFLCFKIKIWPNTG